VELFAVVIEYLVAHLAAVEDVTVKAECLVILGTDRSFIAVMAKCIFALIATQPIVLALEADWKNAEGISNWNGRDV
jgi:hypothetical protein